MEYSRNPSVYGYRRIDTVHISVDIILMTCLSTGNKPVLRAASVICDSAFIICGVPPSFMFKFANKCSLPLSITGLIVSLV